MLKALTNCRFGSKVAKMQPESHNSNPDKQRFTLQLLKPYRKQLFFGFLSLLIVDILDVLPPIIIKTAVDSVENGLGTERLYYCGLILVSAAGIQSFFRFLWRKYFLGTSHMAVYDLRKMLFSHLLKLPFHYFSRTRTGDIMSKLTNDLQEIRFMLGIGILIMLDASFYLLTIPFIMLYMSSRLTLITLASLVLIPVLVFSVSRAIHNRSKDVQARLSDLSSQSEENISGIRIIKGFRCEESELKKFNRVGLEFVRDKIRLANVDSIFHPALDLVIAASMVILLLFGGKMVIAGEITLGVFIAFQAYLLKLSWPMMAIGWVINLYQRAMASLERCLQILIEPPADEHKRKPPVNFENLGLEVENLCFCYPNNEKPALKNVSFSLPQGKTLGITGPVGCGKTTLLRLLVNLFDASSGSIKIGGHDIAELDQQQLRSLFAIVSQETFLFSETIRENILFARENKSDADLAESYARKAGLEPDLKEFPEKLETMLGERGVNLSGGQKQRVSLARAMAADRPFLLLDDCTSAVDTETEQEILYGLKEAGKQRTCIIVSHRMVSLQNADQIIYLVDGQIAESGTHRQLLELKGHYAKTWERQRLKEELERGLS
ncbi:MAG: ABC transporter ATP-binding protein [Candidatus Riflebacteria bacterium]